MTAKDAHNLKLWARGSKKNSTSLQKSKPLNISYAASDLDLHCLPRQSYKDIKPVPPGGTAISFSYLIACLVAHAQSISGCSQPVNSVLQLAVSICGAGQCCFTNTVHSAGISSQFGRI